MKNLLKLDIKTLIIIGLGIFLLIRSCGGEKDGEKQIINVDGKDYELLKQTIDTVFVEKEVKVPTYVPQYITKVVTETVEIPVDVDSLAIIKDYYSKYQIKDTVQLAYDFPEGVTDSLGKKPNSTLGYGIITDIISQNKIESRDIDWFFRIPTVYNTTIVKELPKTQVFYGFNLGVNKQDIFSTAGLGLIVKTKKEKLYQMNLGVQNAGTNGVSPYVGGGMYWKINLKK